MIILQWIIGLSVIAVVLFSILVALKLLLFTAFWFVHLGCQILYGACEDCFRPATISLGGYDPFEVCGKHVKNYR